MADKKGRTIDPSGSAVFKRRTALGLSMKQLAKASKCSERTISRIEKGWPTFLTTLARVAEALKTDVQKLFDADMNPEAMLPNDRITVWTEIAIPFHLFTREKAEELIKALQRIAHDNGGIVVKSTSEGSTLVVLEMTKETYKKLKKAYDRGDLAELDIITFEKVPPSDNPAKVLA